MTTKEKKFVFPPNLPNNKQLYKHLMKPYKNNLIWGKGKKKKKETRETGKQFCAKNKDNHVFESYHVVIGDGRKNFQ